MRTNGQHRPIERTSGLLAERWTPILLRSLLAGRRAFGERIDGAPGTSRALLTQRLDLLAPHEIITEERSCAPSRLAQSAIGGRMRMLRHLHPRPAVVGRRRPWFAIALVVALATPTLMDAQAAGAAVDRNDTSHETPATLGHLDPYRLDQVTLAGSHNTYEKKGVPNDATGNDIRGTFHYLFDALKHVQVIEIDVWNLNGNWWVSHDLPYTDNLLPNNNNCPKSGQVNATRNQDLNSCIAGLHRWHGRHPTHPLVIVKLELKNGFYGGSPASLDALITKRLPRDLIFTPGDLMCRNPPTCTDTFASPDEAARAGGWPTMAQLRGKFMFVMVGGAPTEDVVGQSLFSNAPTRYAEALERGTATLIFPSLLIKKAPAGADPRLLRLCTPKTVRFPLPFGLPSMVFSGCQGQGNYPSPQIARWNVVFDMESGYLPSSPTVANRTISAERISWMRQQNYLIFVTHGRPATPCSAGDAACQRRLTSVACPTTSATCLTQWSNAGAASTVDIVAGRTTLNALAADYKINVVDTDQERLGVFDPRPVTVGDGDSRWDPLSVPSAAAGSPFAPVVATWGGGRVELFARLNDSLWWRSFGPRGWSAWTDLGGTITSDPAAIAYDDGSLYVWAIGPDQVPVAIRRVDNVWSSWQRLNRSDRMLAIGARALGDSAQLFARGTDSTLYRTSVLLQSGSAPPWQVIDGHVIHSAPRSISAGDPSADVYALGGTVLGHVVLTGNGPLPWEGLYPAATGAGVARAADDTIEVFFGAADGSVLRLRWNGALWRLFGQDGVTTTTDPGAVAWSTGDVDVYVRGADGEIYHRRFDGRLGV